ncbi:MAG: class I fructose-bisphosphate aldolase, partial [Phycisphaerae bacterium]
MNSDELVKTAQAMMAPGKGLLAMDESNPTCNRRFAALNIPQTPEMRCAYRDLIVTTPGFGDCISGAILFDETIRQKTNKGTDFADAIQQAHIIPGIKVDLGAGELAAFPGEKMTEGLDGLASRVRQYVKMGARFAKWRAVITIGNGIPTAGCIDANAHTLARYAAIC